MNDYDCENGHHEYAEVECDECGHIYCWTCASGNKNDDGSWDNVSCPKCGTVN